MKTLPKQLYVRIENPENGEPYPVAGASFGELRLDVGDKAKVGLYKFVGTYDAEGMIKTSKLRPAGR